MLPTKNKLFLPQNYKSIIETDDFPIGFISRLAEQESWRKEVHRPIYHLHKWWAKRLGSIFRSAILGCILPENEDIQSVYYASPKSSTVSIFDPFMGSGTTVGEAHKLGCVALGQDINPVACESVRVTLGHLDYERIQAAYQELAASVGNKIQPLYISPDENGELCNVLYFFWVMQTACPSCTVPVDLFSSRIIARNAYPNKKPEVQVCCPKCSDIFAASLHNTHVICPSCKYNFDAYVATVKGRRATCDKCNHPFEISSTIRKTGQRPQYRLYAKLLLTSNGTKRYLRATEYDLKAYAECSKELNKQLLANQIRLPNSCLEQGHNTRQAMNYNFRAWRDFFNDRQLISLAWLQKAISQLKDSTTRDAMFTLFSGILEFNNLFTSYKGEGTGAVRHMFAHHILKPERTPIEANVWGTPKSSGAFSTLYKSRLLRAIEYKNNPREILSPSCSTISRIQNVPFTGKVEETWPSQGNFKERGIYISCASSDQTSLPKSSIDYIVTDPPFFDNVHYSELADFFYAWQTLYPHGFIKRKLTTRDKREVQDVDPLAFATKLRDVFKECNRILKETGLLVFSYHHSRTEGWTSLAEAIFGSGFSVVNAHPVRSEMSVAAPKAQAKEPIQLDVLLVCRKHDNDHRPSLSEKDAIIEATFLTKKKINVLQSAGIVLSRNDVRVCLYSQFFAAIGPVRNSSTIEGGLNVLGESIDRVIEECRTPLAKIRHQPILREDDRQLSLI